MMKVHVKSDFEGDIRRFSLDLSTSHNYDYFQDLERELKKLYGLESGKFVVRYRDDEGDLIGLSSHNEVREALEFTIPNEKGSTILRIFVEDKKKKQERTERGERKERTKREDEEWVPPFMQFFANMSQGTFKQFLPAGRFLHMIGRTLTNISEETKMQFVTVAKHLAESGDMENLFPLVPELFEILKNFTMEEFPTKESTGNVVESAKLDALCNKLREKLSPTISEGSVEMILATIRTGVQDVSVRRFMFFALKRWNWMAYGQGFNFAEKPWEKEEGFSGELVPKPPLKRSDSGPKVMHLQSVLIEIGRMTTENIRWRSGFYGPRTTEAIKKIQEESEITVAESGMYDDATAARIMTMLEEARKSPNAAAAGASASESPPNPFTLISEMLRSLDNDQSKPKNEMPMPWMFGGMSFDPFAMHKLHKLMKGASEKTWNAIEAAKFAVWESGQMGNVIVAGLAVYGMLKQFAQDNISESNAASPVDEVKLNSLLTSIGEKLVAEGVSTAVSDKIIDATRQALNEESVRTFIAEAKNRNNHRHHRHGASNGLSEKPWEKEDGFNGESAPNAPLQPGDSGLKVMHLQAVMIELGKMSISNVRFRAGRYGPHTEAAVRKIQEENNLSHSVEKLGSYDALTAATVSSLVEAERAATTPTPMETETSAATTEAQTSSQPQEPMSDVPDSSSA